jgi:hypothetical protein
LWAAGFVPDHLPAAGFVVGEDEQGTEQVGDQAGAGAGTGAVRSLVRMRQAFRWAKQSSTRARAAEITLLAVFWPVVSLRFLVAF